ncbi:MAG: PfkB family carbohydrate kinase [Gemmatimonadota bacterium]|jgi:D-beta-D-heptose 7-phosphate kinase/D-beta-D-heptose 1-phosphate adenosyltransferase
MQGISEARVGEILDAARGVRVLVVGDLMLDRYIAGAVDRISPEAPVPVVRVDDESYAVGGAGNVAAQVVALGATCDVVGIVGDDEAGALLRQALVEQGVEVHGLVATRERPTTTKIRVLARRQQIVRVDRERDEDVAPDLARELAGAVRELASGCAAVALEDYNKGVLVEPVIAAGLGRDGSHALPSVVDPKRIRFFEYRGATVFKPNAKELADALSDHLHPEDEAWMEHVRVRMECDHLLLTLGERGMALQTASGEYVRVPAVAREVFDVSGAGDTVTAVMAVCLAAGATPVEGALLANHAAALEVGKVGVATVGPDEILGHHREAANR